MDTDNRFIVKSRTRRTSINFMRVCDALVPVCETYMEEPFGKCTVIGAETEETNNIWCLCGVT